jgi:hypothetical protein
MRVYISIAATILTYCISSVIAIPYESQDPSRWSEEDLNKRDYYLLEDGEELSKRDYYLLKDDDELSKRDLDSVSFDEDLIKRALAELNKREADPGKFTSALKFFSGKSGGSQKVGSNFLGKYSNYIPF